MKTKTCSRCGKTKPLAVFVRVHTSADGRTAYCAACSQSTSGRTRVTLDRIFDPDAEDLRDGEAHQLLKARILTILDEGRRTLRVLVSDLVERGWECPATVHYHAGLAIDELAAKEIIEVDDRNPQIPVYGLRTRPAFELPDPVRWDETLTAFAKPPKVKACKACGETKTLDRFYPEIRNRDGRRHKCAECHVEAITQRRMEKAA